MQVYFELFLLGAVQSTMNHNFHPKVTEFNNPYLNRSMQIVGKSIFLIRKRPVRMLKITLDN